MEDAASARHCDSGQKAAATPLERHQVYCRRAGGKDAHRRDAGGAINDTGGATGNGRRRDSILDGEQSERPVAGVAAGLC